MEITEFEKELTKKDISILESNHNIKFPEEYVNHLLKYNGGIVSPNVFSFIEHGKKSESMIDWFLAIYDGEHDNLDDYINTFRGRIEDKIIPIAHDPLGNLICISCRYTDYGSIYFWNHENESSSNNLILIGSSFNEFLFGLFSIGSIT